MSVATAPVVGAEARIEAEQLAHRYTGGHGLEPLSFRCAGPGVVAVTGANGSGKSTLLRILAGVLRPSAGQARVMVDGTALAPGARRGHVGFATPELSFYDEMSARENLVFAAEALGARPAPRVAAAALERVGLEGRAADRVAALSSGLRQRLRLAFALLLDPPVLLLDEPGSHLDDDGRALVARLVDQRRRAGLVLIATNDEREWRLADQRIELRGRGLGHPS